MDMATQVQILDKTVCISNNANTLAKDMNPIILLQAIVGQIGLFNLGMATGLGERKLWIQTCLTLLKTDHVSRPACVEEFDKYILLTEIML